MWYVMQVLTGEEKNTIDMCVIIVKESKLHDFFMPEVERRMKFHGQWKDVRRPMFPGYIFINTEHIDELYEELKKVPKLTKVLSADHIITPVLRKEEDFIRRITNTNHVAEVSVGYIEGARLIIEQGPMVGMEGYVKKIDRHRRQAVLELEMFGSMTEVTMGLEVLRKV